MTCFMQNITVVTAFFNIGRDCWENYTRKEEEYLLFFKNLLSFRVNMVIFTEPKYEDFVNKCREKQYTHLVLQKFEELESHKYLEKIQKIMESKDIARYHPNPSAPEVCKPMYNTLVINKLNFVAKAIEVNPFNSSHFFWIDAGYTHGTMNLALLSWYPSSIMMTDNLTVIARSSVNNVDLHPFTFYKKYIDVIIGGFFGGKKEACLKVKDLYYKFLEYILYDLKITDDDQYYMSLLVRYKPEFFNIVMADWYGGILID